MANPEHVELLLQGSKIWNEWRKENPDIVPQLNGAILKESDLSDTNLTLVNLSHSDLSHSDLSGAYMSGVHLSDVDLDYANLKHVDLSYAYLNESDLSHTDIRFAHLSHTNFSRVNFYAANLSYSHLSITNFSFSDLRKADLTSVNLNYVDLSNTKLCDAAFFATKLSNVDLSSTLGLESIRHIGPSTLGIDTFLKSQGNIPNEFLLGCGLTQDFIDHMRLLTMSPLQFNSCFISYCHKDEEFARHLHTNLQNNNVRVWYAPEDIKSGRKVYEQVDQAIQMHDKLLILLSKASIESDWVRTEITKAHERERKEKRQILFPISLVPFEQIREWDFFDNVLGKSLAGEVMSYHIPDFSDWKTPASFEQKFGKLLRDLKGGKNTPRAPLPKMKW